MSVAALHLPVRVLDVEVRRGRARTIGFCAVSWETRVPLDLDGVEVEASVGAEALTVGNGGVVTGPSAGELSVCFSSALTGGLTVAAAPWRLVLDGVVWVEGHLLARD